MKKTLQLLLSKRTYSIEGRWMICQTDDKIYIQKAKFEKRFMVQLLLQYGRPTVLVDGRMV